MKALSLHQPWAHFIAEGVKTIETRTWGTRYRGLLVICATKQPLPASPDRSHHRTGEPRRRAPPGSPGRESSLHGLVARAVCLGTRERAADHRGPGTRVPGVVQPPHRDTPPDPGAPFRCDVVCLVWSVPLRAARGGECRELLLHQMQTGRVTGQARDLATGHRTVTAHYTRVLWRICTFPGCNRIRDFTPAKVSKYTARNFPYCGWHKNPVHRETPECRRRRIYQGVTHNRRTP